MSGRQSLLGQSLVRNANALNFNQDSSIDKHWKRDWYSPAKPTQSNTITPSGTPTPFGEEQIPQEQHYSFKVKTWILDENYKAVVDGEEEDLLDLDKYSTVKHSETNGLTDQAIRGAVATDGDAIPGISKSTDAATAAEEKKQSKEELKEEPKIEELKESKSELATVEFGPDTPKLKEKKEEQSVEIELKDSKSEEPTLPLTPEESKAETMTTETSNVQVLAASESKDADGDVVID